MKDLLRFITCGSVDDGKSTLIGRLLYDCQLVPDDQLAALERDSQRQGNVESGLDFSLLVDGLEAEREQGITIDVAWRFFATPHRTFIVADTPGHEQYTRNMATGASTVDLAVLLVDARKGVLVQTRRHSTIVHLMGIQQVVVAINKMDAVSYDEATFQRIAADYQEFAARLGIASVTCIPVAALLGDNIANPSSHMPWYSGPTLLQHLETVPPESALHTGPVRFPVQWVNRPDQNFRGYAGTVAGGRVSPGDAVTVLPSGRRSVIERIVTQDGDLATAIAGQAITLTLADEVDIVRGDVIVASDDPLRVSDQFEAHVVWMDETPLLPGRPYILKIGPKQVGAQVSSISHRINVNTQEQTAAKRLELNEVAVVHLTLDQPIAFAPYAENRAMGGFILINRLSNATVACGMIDFALRLSSNVHWQALDVNKAARGLAKGQRPCVLWFTGLSGSGKSTIANLVEKRLAALGHHTYLLDGDNVRHGLNKDLGFSDEDRIENIRRIAEVAKLFVDAGLIVLVSFISPFRTERQYARSILEDGEFIEVFVDTPLDICEQRDPKGLYKKARRGEIRNFTGIESAYEPPLTPEMHLLTATSTAQALAAEVVAGLGDLGVVGGDYVI